jgi:hypothetical protein
MPFVARCPFCHLKVRKVPDQRRGTIASCTRCQTRFTLEPDLSPMEALAARTSGALAETSPPAPPVVPANEPMTVARLVEEAFPERSAKPIELSAAQSLAERRPPNYPGLASFVLASFAVFAAAVLHVGPITFAMGLVALLLGIIGLVSPVPKQSLRILPAAGLAVSLPAVIVAAFLPHWIGMSPLWNPTRPDNRGVEAVIDLSGRAGARRETKGETLWVDASRDALLHGDVRIRVRSAVVGTVEFEPVHDQKPPRERGLMIGLRITNAGIIRKLRYTSWGNGSQTQDRPALRDNQGKSYPEKAFFDPAWIVKGRATTATIPPGKFIDDVLVFEAPAEPVDYFRLELPASAVSAKGLLHFEIPKQMIHFR